MGSLTGCQLMLSWSRAEHDRRILRDVSPVICCELRGLHITMARHAGRACRHAHRTRHVADADGRSPACRRAVTAPRGVPLLRPLQDPVRRRRHACDRWPRVEAIQWSLDGRRQRTDRADVWWRARLRGHGRALSLPDRRDERQPGPDCRRVWQQAHGSSREHVATGGFDGAGCRAQDHAHEPAPCAITAESPAGGGQLAVVPWTAGRRRGRRTAPARALGSEHRREHPLAHADSRARPFESDRLGRSRVRHHARSAASPNATFKPGCTATAMRRTIARAAMGDLRDRQAHGQDCVGARGPRGRAARPSGTSSRPTRAPRPPPTGASSSPGSARRACTPTT